MKILITGGTGLIGSALCRALLEDGHMLSVLSRKPGSVEARCGHQVQAMSSLDQWQPERDFDAVINLAGEPIVGKRWTAGRKQDLWDSRVTLTARLVEKILQANNRPRVLISGSAVGLYGDRGDLDTDEDTASADDFGARLCRAWEQEAMKAEAHAIRTCVVRTGLVLSVEGGMLAQMLLPFRLGLGSRIGDGRQWMSWIHIKDHLDILRHLLNDERCRGAYNLCAPNPVDNTTFSRQLAQSLHRPLFLRAPAGAIRALLGESAMLLLGGQKVAPRRILSEGYRFQFPTLESALDDLL